MYFALQIFVLDFLRAVFLRVMNPCWFWDMERGFPKYPDFKVAENILHLVNNQVWMMMLELCFCFSTLFALDLDSFYQLNNNKQINNK